MRVTLDTNILAHATFSRKGPARKVVEELTVAPHELILSEAILIELQRILQYPRMRALHGFDDTRIEAELHALRTLAHVVVPANRPNSEPVVAADPTDDVIVATAVAGQAEILCTLDKHLRQEEVVEYCRQFGIHVLTDVELLQVLHP